MPEYTNIHVHSEFSLLDGVGRLEDYAKRAAEYGMSACAITEHGNMYSAIKAYDIFKKHGIKLIVGMEAYLCEDVSVKDRNNNHLILLCESQIGYHNLMKLATLSSLEGFHYRARIDRAMLARHHEGLIATTACLAGPTASAVVRGDMPGAYAATSSLVDIFGQNNLYIEIQENGLSDQYIANGGLIEISRTMGLPLVAASDTHYLNREDAKLQDLLICIGTQSQLSQTNRLKIDTDQLYFRSVDEMAQAFHENPESLVSTMEIAERCTINLDFDGYKLPYLELPRGETADSYLRKLAFDGSNVRGLDTENYSTRLEYELSVIASMGMSSYILIVNDFIKFARSRGILIGPGRGSAGGSLLCYCLKITDVDPIRYDLIFERFLMPGRLGMPDVDVDIQDDRRWEVIEYVKQKYGADHVAQIITFGSLTARMAIKDTARASGVNYSMADSVSKMVPTTIGMTLTTALAEVPDLKAVYDTDPEMKSVIDTSLRIEGISRHVSTHAAGIVVGDRPLNELIPVQNNSKKEIVTGYPMFDVERIGLLKIDFLGISSLTVLANAAKLIPGFEIEKIPMDDPDTFSMLQRGETLGIFQLEGSMSTKIITGIKPTSFEEVALITALVRPGSRDMTGEYIARKHGRSPVEYMHPDMEPILRDTYGVLIYQEQVLRIAQIFAGFSLPEAESLRKIISKKFIDQIGGYKEKFITGCVKNGYTLKLSTEIWEAVQKHAWYSLNRAHASVYGKLAVYTAYMKCHYPIEFMSAFLSSEIGDTDRIIAIVAESRRLGIEILGPDINKSQKEFVIEGESIRFGFSAIKYISEVVANHIVEVRKAGLFSDLEDVCTRLDWNIIDKRTIESLAKSGCFDSFHDRSEVVSSVKSFISSSKSMIKASEAGQITLFDVGAPIYVRDKPVSKEDRLAMEKELTGVYLSDHPLRGFEYLYASGQYVSLSNINEELSGEWISVLGIITKVRKFITKTSNKAMAIINFEDLSKSVEIVIFPKTFAQYGAKLREGALVIVHGKVEERDGRFQLIGTQVESHNHMPEMRMRIDIPFTDDEWNDVLVMRHVREIILEHPGPYPVIIRAGNRSLLSKHSASPDVKAIIEKQTECKVRY